jgi:hypothetical protein
MSSRASSIRSGVCVRLSDGRIGRVQRAHEGCVDVSTTRRRTGTTEVLELEPREVKVIACPPGRMSPEGYRRFRARERAGEYTCN